MEDCVKQLQELHYEFHEYEKAGSYKRQGDIISLRLMDMSQLVINFWGNEIESLQYK